jgi:hypothetical protein
MKKKVSVFSVLLILLLIQACNVKKEKSDIFIEILNDTFLTITDTFAYSQHSFILVHNYTFRVDTIQFGLSVGINKKLIPSIEHQQQIKQILLENNKTNYLTLFDTSTYKPLVEFDLTKIKNIGKYTLHENKNIDKLDTNYVGHLVFYEPLISDDVAILFIATKKYVRDGWLNAYLVEKKLNIWKIVETIEIERY